MDSVQLGKRQIFSMKMENLTKRVQLYHEQDKNTEPLIQYMVAILVRSALCVDKISEGLIDLIRDVYLTSAPNDAMRQYSPYFKAYFSGSEWKLLIKKLFKNDANYFACTEEARFYNNYLQKEGTLNNRRKGLIYHVESIFEDANGKKHKLTIRDTDPTKDIDVTTNILRTLTTLTVFETGGVRKFVEFINYKTPGIEIATAYDHRKAEKALAAEEQLEGVSNNSQQSVSSKTETNTMDKVSVATQRTNDSIDTEKSPAAASTGNQSRQRSAPSELAASEPINEPQSNTSSQKKKSGKSAAPPKKRDTSYMRYGKSKEQIDEAREKRRLKRGVDKKIGKKKKRK